MHAFEDFIADLKSLKDDDKEYKLDIEYFPISESIQNEINDT